MNERDSASDDARKMSEEEFVDTVSKLSHENRMQLLRFGLEILARESAGVKGRKLAQL